MIVELVSFLVLILFPVFIAYGLLSQGTISEIIKKYKLVIKYEPKIAGLKWTPFYVVQNSKPNTLYVNISKSSVSEKGIYIVFFFPFSLFIPSLLIPWCDTDVGGRVRKIGVKHKKIFVRNIESGYLLMPENLINLRENILPK